MSRIVPPNYLLQAIRIFARQLAFGGTYELGIIIYCYRCTVNEINLACSSLMACTIKPAAVEKQIGSDLE